LRQGFVSFFSERDKAVKRGGHSNRAWTSDGNYHTLKLLNRGHLLAEFIDAVLAIKRYGLESCAHYILDIPMDSMDDVIEGARILSALGVNQVKCHSLYILKDTVLGKCIRGEIKHVTLEEYIERAISFLSILTRLLSYKGS